MKTYRIGMVGSENSHALAFANIFKKDPGLQDMQITAIYGVLMIGVLMIGQLVLLPIEPSLDGYAYIAQYKDVWTGYANTLFYTVVGTIIGMIMRILAAYPLSRKTFQGRNIYMKIFYFCTLFGAGLIPSFILHVQLGMFDTIWPVLLAAAVSVSDIINSLFLIFESHNYTPFFVNVTLQT